MNLQVRLPKIWASGAQVRDLNTRVQSLRANPIETLLCLSNMVKKKPITAMLIQAIPHISIQNCVSRLKTKITMTMVLTVITRCCVQEGVILNDNDKKKSTHILAVVTTKYYQTQIYAYLQIVTDVSTGAYIYIHIHRDGYKHRNRNNVQVHTCKPCIYIYTHIYIYRITDTDRTIFYI